MSTFFRTSLALSLFLSFIVIGCGEDKDSSKLLNSYFAKSFEAPVYVRLPITMLTKEFVKKVQFNRDSKKDDIYAFGYIPRENFIKLSDAQLNQIVELDEEVLRHYRFDAKTLEVFNYDERVTKADFYEDYHNYEALKTELQKMERDYPNFVKLESAGKSGAGRELFYIRISDNISVDESEPRLLMVGNMHGDETVGRELVIYLARMLLGEYNTNSRVKNLVDNAEIVIMPSMNPDGFEKRTRYNANGADLNRSFPDFDNGSADGPSGKQPEVKAMMDFHSKYYIHLALNFHGGAVCFNLSWDTKANEPESERFEDDAVMSYIARKYADANATMVTESGGSFDRGVTYGYEWYEVDGGMQDWASYYRKSIHAVAELSDVKWPSAQNLPSYWNENRESFFLFLEHGLLGVHLQIVDEGGKPINNAAIGVSSSRRDLSFNKNLVHRLAPPGTHNVKVSAPNFADAELTLPATMFNGKFQTVVLKKK